MNSLKSMVAIASCGIALQMALPTVALAQAGKRTHHGRRASASRPCIPGNGSNPTAKGAGTYYRCRPTPPKNGRYVTRKGAASRSCGSEKTLLSLAPSEQLNEPSALIPKLSTGGFTTQARPSFWFQVPFRATELKQLEFVLLDENDEDTYRTTLKFAPQGTDSPSDLLQVTLPETQPEIALDHRYRWFLKARLNCGVEGNAGTQFVKGWIQRYEPDAALANQLAGATPLQQAQYYANAGVWFDALNILATLQLADPQDAAVQTTWQDLLKLYAIELQDLEQSTD